ncbi:pilus assembly protein Flp/PilA [Bisgaardia hudsonensis]|uniref:Pilus assembly protein Flp/PilA n=1 Tax=Bisgaardia hudsonensis TaxID=109472 RepID=A0A4R2MTB3_9PAST|nr:Flp family type IVb pilin [Bisgaardia hudsonensis]QLB12359.1 fimbrial protein [Bisgaardia hudsonensis]TCP12409.1 pilus assembly protein Flp/PilA [Bisgaardia hudsonensis]
MLNQLTTKAYINVTESLHDFKNNTKGVTAIEYGLIAIAVAAMIVVVFYSDTGFIQKLKGKFGDLTSLISGTTVSNTATGTP